MRKDPASMEKTLQFLFQKPINLTITDNRRSIISARWRDKAYHIRLHHLFLEANDDILRALAAYITNQSETASKKINVFIRENEHKIRQAHLAPKKRKTICRPKGRFFDLQEIYQTLNGKYFDNRIGCNITWGNRRRLTGQKSVRLGSYSSHTKTIRIHPALDRSFVPDYVVHDVVYHEMLHSLLGVERENGRNYSHHKRFREFEENYPTRKRAEEWIILNLNRLVSARPR